MDFDGSQSQDSVSDAAYDPQILNETDQIMGGAEPMGNNGYGNGQQAQYRPQSSDYPHSSNPMSPMEGHSQYNSPNLPYQPQSSSRPGSGMGGQQQYQAQYQDQNRQAQAPNKSSVVIKVGMVGDAQIGKTSLMVKYVEGSWDEDYIQTLGRA